MDAPMEYEAVDKRTRRLFRRYVGKIVILGYKNCPGVKVQPYSGPFGWCLTPKPFPSFRVRLLAVSSDGKHIRVQFPGGKIIWDFIEDKQVLKVLYARRRKKRT